MLRAAPLVLVAGSLACTSGSALPYPVAEASARSPWDELERKCARGDDPPHLERMFVGEQQHEQLLVPLGVEPALGTSRSWFLLGGEDPGLTPFEWTWLMPEVDEPEARRSMAVEVELVSPTALELTVVPMSVSVSGWVVHALLERRPSGELVGTLDGGWFTDIEPFRGRWGDLEGALRVSTPAWNVPGLTVAVHLELSSATAATCGQLLVEIPPHGRPRRMQIPTTPTRLAEPR